MRMSTSGLFEELLETSPCRYGLLTYFKSDLVIGRSLKEYGEWAQQEIELLKSLIRVGDIVIDVGAFIGTHTVAFAHFVGENGLIYAFEPNPLVFKVLELNVRQNNFLNVKLFNVGLAAERKLLHLDAFPCNFINNPGAFSLTEIEGWKNLACAITVELMPLDEFDLQRCNLIKIDVEGMEDEVIKGANKLLEKFRPFVYAECLSVEDGVRLITLMQNKSYKAFVHCVSVYNPNNFRRNNKNLFGKAREVNILFVPFERLGEFNSEFRRFRNLIPIKTLDDLVLVLIYKPQYKHEVLEKTETAKFIGNEFWANEPELEEIRKQQKQTVLFKAEQNQLFNQKIEQNFCGDSVRNYLMMFMISRFALKRPIFMVDHEIGGGANKYRCEIMEERIKEGQPIFLLTYDLMKRAPKLRFLWKEYDTSFLIPNLEELLRLTDHIAFEEIIYNNLVSFDCCLNIVRLLRKMKEKTEAKLTLLIHDFFSICPSPHLLNWKGVYCDIPEDLKECQKCLSLNTFINPLGIVDDQQRDIRIWREEWGKLLEIADCVLFPSESALALVKKVYSLQPKQIVVRPHKVPKLFDKKPVIDFTSGLNIGIVGVIHYAKGWKIVVEMAEIIDKEKLNAKITVIGTLTNAPAFKSLIITGPYQIPELPDLIESCRVNICFLPSIWPETFSYVISELMQLEMPICCFNLGAQAERVRKYELGRIISKIDAKTALREIMMFFEELKSKQVNKNPNTL